MKRELKLKAKCADCMGNYADCRAYPDEKGIETSSPCEGVMSADNWGIAEPIPMKRELKQLIKFWIKER